LPARRSRTLEWRSCLDQVLERGGALEIAVLRPQENRTATGSHLVWRVRMLQITDDEILVEPPMTLGEVIRVEDGVELVAVLAVGQNRWMFKTSHLGPIEHQRRGQRPITAMRLAMPPSVERCQRRNYFRMETGAVLLPEVEVWPLLDPKSVLIAERANELQFEEDRKGNGRARPADEDNELILPEVGPKFTAMLLNIGGGGLGLRVRPEDDQSLARHKIFWLRFTLPPELTTPICATAKLAHTNVDSTQHTYAGLAFDFSFNPVHQRFIVEQICQFISMQQRDQAA